MLNIRKTKRHLNHITTKLDIMENMNREKIRQERNPHRFIVFTALPLPYARLQKPNPLRKVGMRWAPKSQYPVWRHSCSLGAGPPLVRAIYGRSILFTSQVCISSVHASQRGQTRPVQDATIPSAGIVEYRPHRVLTCFALWFRRVPLSG